MLKAENIYVRNWWKKVQQVPHCVLVYVLSFFFLFTSSYLLLLILSLVSTFMFNINLNQIITFSLINSTRQETNSQSNRILSISKSKILDKILKLCNAFFIIFLFLYLVFLWLYHM